MAFFSFNFFKRRGAQEMRVKKAAIGGVAFRLEKTGFACFVFFMYVLCVWSLRSV